MVLHRKKPQRGCASACAARRMSCFPGRGFARSPACARRRSQQSPAPGISRGRRGSSAWVPSDSPWVRRRRSQHPRARRAAGLSLSSRRFATRFRRAFSRGRRNRPVPSRRRCSPATAAPSESRSCRRCGTPESPISWPSRASMSASSQASSSSPCAPCWRSRSRSRCAIRSRNGRRPGRWWARRCISCFPA